MDKPTARIEVLFAAGDGTHKIHRYTAPGISSQLWPHGRANITLRDESGGWLGSAQYSHAVCMRRGVACDSDDTL